ncbi:cytochrome b5 [Fusarium subglutinans]|uniref:Cytochrome b5 n=2 Tax=Fusarium fujikuroi species complex TaxID=171627 RepID=A0A8H5Q3N0_GIBSU|nr:cytochrome b5 [Fusarium subglutinans]KAF5606951.1 cytochrome b5 [Fusarium subglutinans]
MSAKKEFTMQDVAEHNTSSDIYMVVHDKVYDCTKFLDEHPGGEEVMLDVAGQDATEAFEDVGHSDEAREVLDGLLVGELKRLVSNRALYLDGANANMCPLQPGDEGPKRQIANSNQGSGTSDPAGSSLNTYAIVVAVGFIAYVAYNYLQKQQEAQGQASA